MPSPSPSNPPNGGVGNAFVVAGKQLARVPWALYGFVAFSAGLAMYFVGVLMVFPRYLLGLDRYLLPVSEWLVWYSGLPLVLGMAVVLADLLLLLALKRPTEEVLSQPIGERHLTVALTAYNDELSIGDAVRDFREHPLVTQVIVVSNNSSDATMAVAAEAGATTFDELRPGYGWCVYRCLSEALAIGESDLIVLCEGDGTFRAKDVEKLLAYAPHADIVNGTRTVERLRQPRTQLTTFMYYGNFFVGKLLESKHVGKCTITDVGIGSWKTAAWISPSPATCSSICGRMISLPYLQRCGGSWQPPVRSRYCSRTTASPTESTSTTTPISPYTPTSVCATS